MTTESIKTIVAGTLPHVRDALQHFAEGPCNHTDRAYIEGYLIAALKSGNLLDAHCDRLMHEIKTADGHRTLAACFEPVAKLPPITEGERSLWRYKFEHPGGFERNLWETFFTADSTNLAHLTNGFPSHSEAFRRYATEGGYWEALIARIRKGEW